MTAPGPPLSRKQVAAIIESQARVNILDGSIRSGKTVASLVRWLTYVADAPRGGELLMVAKTTQTAHRNVFLPLTDPTLFGDLARHVHYTPGAPTGTILGRTVHVVGANDAKAESKIRGLTCAGAYVDEASLVPWAFFNQLIGRMSVPGAKLFATTNPDNPGHWLRKEFILSGSPDVRSWHFTLDDNHTLDPAYVAHVKAQYTGLFYRRFILGEWCLADGAVFDMWDPDRHVVHVLPRVDRWIAVGIDYGTVNPFAALILGLGADRRLYLVAEWRYDSAAARRSLTDAEYSARLRTWLTEVPVPTTALRGVAPEWVVIDPSAASFRVQLHRDGVTGTLANNDVISGIRTVASLLATGRLRVHSSCAGWLEEVGGYSWDSTAAARGEDKPIKADDHSLDAGRYALHTTRAVWRDHLTAPVLEAA